MKGAGKIGFMVVSMLIFAGHTSFAQVVSADTLRTEIQKSRSDVADNSRGAKVNENGQSGMAGNNNAGRSVKQVRGGRPDMTRARGARPPSIVRPSGSQIPKGVGKPGGAGRKGGR